MARRGIPRARDARSDLDTDDDHDGRRREPGRRRHPPGPVSGRSMPCRAVYSAGRRAVRVGWRKARLRALLSVANRDGISGLARELLALGVEVYATDGTREHL